jgi:hypothetical protein
LSAVSFGRLNLKGEVFVCARMYYLRVFFNSVESANWSISVARKSFSELIYLRDGFFICVLYASQEASALDASETVALCKALVSQLDQRFEERADLFTTIVGSRSEKLTPFLGSYMFIYPTVFSASMERLNVEVAQSRIVNVLNPANSTTAFSRLSGRLEAVRLFSFANSSVSPAARLNGFVRLFEAAFGMKHNALKNPLHRFLSSGRLGISKKTSDAWISFRNDASHGANDTRLIYDSDVLFTLPPARMAAYDVIVNKTNWRSADHGRLLPDGLATVVDVGNHVTGTQHHFMALGVVETDFFARFARSYFGEHAGFEFSINALEVWNAAIPERADDPSNLLLMSATGEIGLMSYCELAGVQEGGSIVTPHSLLVPGKATEYAVRKADRT